eukprot:gene2288-2461_t
MSKAQSTIIFFLFLIYLCSAQDILPNSLYYGNIDFNTFNLTNITNSTKECIIQCLNNTSTGSETAAVFGIEEIAKLAMSCVLVGLSGLFSGLTLGLLGLDTVALEIISESGSPNERKYAKRILPLRARGNLLLCTLLLGNVAVNSALSILTSELSSGIFGFLISTSVITLFGEIVPQAFCSRYALFVGAHTTWIVYVFLIFMFPIAYPLSFLLDKILGKEIGTLYSNEELIKLIEITAQSKQGELQDFQAKILGGALTFAQKTVNFIMTKTPDIYALNENQKLDVETMTQIWQSGRSRIPVYKKDINEIVGLIFAKDLILVNPEDELPLSTVLTFYGREIVRVFPDAKLEEILKVFKTGKSHLAVVHDVRYPENGDPFYVTLGIVTLEDVIEEILKEEIADETEVIEIDNLTNQQITKQKAVGVGISLLSKKTKTERLTPQQAVAVGSFLSKTYEEFRILPDDALQTLLGKSHVISLNFSSKEDTFIYQRNIEAKFFMLVLNGKIEIDSGEDHFLTEKGSWTSIGIKSLNRKNFIPDYSCRILNSVKYLNISKEDYINVILHEYEIDKSTYIPENLKWILNEHGTMKSNVILPSPRTNEKKSEKKLKGNSKYSKFEEEEEPGIELMDVVIEKSDVEQNDCSEENIKKEEIQKKEENENIEQRDNIEQNDESDKVEEISSNIIEIETMNDNLEQE